MIAPPGWVVLPGAYPAHQIPHALTLIPSADGKPSGLGSNLIYCEELGPLASNPAGMPLYRIWFRRPEQDDYTDLAGKKPW